jgi:hypothetical protein
VSLHPRFVHVRKRYSVAFAFGCLRLLRTMAQTMYAVALAKRVSRSTLRRWRQGLSAGEPTKRACFFHTGRSPPQGQLVAALWSLLLVAGNGDITTGAVTAMVRLQHEFCCRLY